MKSDPQVVRFAGCRVDVSSVPLRRVVRRGGVRANVKFCSRKMRNRMIPTESSNEHAFLVRAELDPSVTHIYAQAVVVTWRDDSGPRRHFPDFVVVRDGRVEVHEVKPDSETESEDVKSALAYATGYFFERGATYGLTLESALKAKPTFDHIKEALHRLHDWIDEALARAVVAFVQDHGPTSIAVVVAALAAKGCTLEAVLTLVAHNRLHVDYRYPLDSRAVLHDGRGEWNEVPPLLPYPGSGGTA